MNSWTDKRILITGTCGTVGRELLHQIALQQPHEIIGIDNNESDLFFLAETYRNNPRVRFRISDIRNKTTLTNIAEGIDIIVHAAAFKHVILCEESPQDAVQTNILGTQNVIQAAQLNHVERVIFTSSDKAVNPTNVMGTSKLMGERLMTASNAHRRDERPVFASTRFGNVLGSRGSVIPLFKKQIANGGPVTLTDPSMTRFIMTLEESARLVMESVFLARGGEIFVTKMPVVRIEDLASLMIEILAPEYGYEPEDIKIETIGCKAGEKVYEELMNEEEVRRTLELEKYFVIFPAFRSVYREIDYSYPKVIASHLSQPFNSRIEKPLDKHQLRQYLFESKVLLQE